MNESTFFLLAFLAYGLAALAYFAFRLGGKDRWAGAGFILASAGLAIHSIALVIRTFGSGHAPFTNMYESISFLAWASALAYIVMEARFRVRKAGPYIMLLIVALMALASSPLMPKEAAPLVPALQSYWLWLHVSVTLLGEAFFAIAFVTSLLYLKAESAGSQGPGRGRGQGRRSIRRHELQGDRPGVPPVHAGRARLRDDLGLQGLGELLELGSEGSLVAHHLARVRPLSPYPDRHGLAGPEVGPDRGARIPGRALHLLWSQLSSVRTAQLRLRRVS